MFIWLQFETIISFSVEFLLQVCLTSVSCIFQCLVNVIKSLVNWEKAQRESGKLKESSEVENSAKESDDSKGREDQASNFEKLKAHKSTLEAAVAEVYTS
mgnify:FL=1